MNTTTTLTNDTFSDNILPIGILTIFMLFIIYFTIYSDETTSRRSIKTCPMHHKHNTLDTNNNYLKTQKIWYNADNTNTNNMLYTKKTCPIHNGNNNNNNIILENSVYNVQNGNLLSSNAQHELDSITKLVKYKQLCTV
jgi:hypothetical protein